jgi:hypothetical protein
MDHSLTSEPEIYHWGKHVALTELFLYQLLSPWSSMVRNRTCHSNWCPHRRAYLDLGCHREGCAHPSEHLMRNVYLLLLSLQRLPAGMKSSLGNDFVDRSAVHPLSTALKAEQLKARKTSQSAMSDQVDLSWFFEKQSYYIVCPVRSLEAIAVLTSVQSSTLACAVLVVGF